MLDVFFNFILQIQKKITDAHIIKYKKRQEKIVNTQLEIGRII